MADIADGNMSREEAREDDFPPDIGDNLRRLRRQQGHSLDSLGKLAGVSRAMLGQIETGKSVPTITLVWKIANALHVPLTSLVSSPGARSYAILRGASAPLSSFSDGRFTIRSFNAFQHGVDVDFSEVTIAPLHREILPARVAGSKISLAVAKGAISIELAAAEAITLREADSILFFADVPYALSNPGADSAIGFLVSGHVRSLRRD